MASLCTWAHTAPSQGLMRHNVTRPKAHPPAGFSPFLTQLPPDGLDALAAACEAVAMDVAPPGSAEAIAAEAIAPAVAADDASEGAPREDPPAHAGAGASGAVTVSQYSSDVVRARVYSSLIFIRSRLIMNA